MCSQLLKNEATVTHGQIQYLGIGFVRKSAGKAPVEIWGQVLPEAGYVLKITLHWCNLEDSKTAICHYSWQFYRLQWCEGAVRPNPTNPTGSASGNVILTFQVVGKLDVITQLQMWCNLAVRVFGCRDKLLLCMHETSLHRHITILAARYLPIPLIRLRRAPKSHAV